ncbi:hypothetical protein PNEG_03461 [Pneumocystis murina B123]|uniref:Uncharacterized protein n=1 Tax=Pneumocystis murina (strain B123) TaxID=1069680 RepID=M7PC16_PNEMU|nr:hypothetical protein PNEG_03461 [Pneumocystis murina B123]EMR08019.1 hypothetical protein PNEG_03461 [Pneumocystis murina B123]
MILKILRKRQANTMSRLENVSLCILKKIRHFYTEKACNENAKLGSKKENRNLKSNDKKKIQNKKRFSEQSDYIKWLVDPMEGGQYIKPLSKAGTNFIHQKEYPYPLNPKFKPQPPLSLEARRNIGEKWKQGKSLREISDMFGISVIRVEAVLRLLELESKWRQEERTLDSYAQTMHHMLGSATNQSFNEPPFFVFTPSETQNFTLIHENSEFTSKDAADELQRCLYSDFKEKVIQFQSNTFLHNKHDISNKELKLQKEIINSISEKNRFDLKVVDSYTGNIWLLSKGLLKQIKIK